jgi:flagellar biogenesis protein FliO
MYISPNALTVIILILALILLTLYIMRRRVRLGRRQGKF